MHNSDGTQYPWLSAYNVTGRNMKFFACINTKLIGSFNKDSNRNYVPANLACPTCNQHLRAAMRSQQYGGI